MFFAVYDKSTGEVQRTISTPFYIPEMFVLSDNEDFVEVPREVNDTVEYIKDGILTTKSIADETAE